MKPFPTSQIPDSKGIRTRVLCDFPDCDKTFYRPPDMMRHKREVHEQVKKCPWCEYECRRDQRLVAHIESNHRPKKIQYLHSAEETGLEEKSLANIDDRATDSGYHTGIHTHTVSERSANSCGSSIILPADTLQEFIDFFIKSVVDSHGFTSWFPAIQFSSPPELLQVIEDLVVSYSQSLSAIATASLEQKASKLVCRQSGVLARTLQQYSGGPIASSFGQLKFFMSLMMESSAREKVEYWRSCLHEKDLFVVEVNVHENHGGDELALDEDEHEDEEIDFEQVSSFLTKSPPFEELIRGIKLLYYDPNSRLREIRLIVSDAFDGSAPDDRGNHHASISLNWDLFRFMESQFATDEMPLLGSVITLSGSAFYAQAVSCAQYLYQTWPFLGPGILELFQAAIVEENHHSSAHFFGLEISTSLARTCTIEVCGPRELIVEATQVIAWLGSAARESSTNRIQSAEVTISHEHDCTFLIEYQLSDLREPEKSCWQPLFTNPVIASGWPIQHRDNDEIGLEAPMELMAALAGVRHAFDFEGGLVLKGFSTALVPIKRCKSSTQWHLISSSDERHITYSEIASQYPARASVASVDLKSLGTTRMFLGWWNVSEVQLGTKNATYSGLLYSGLEPLGRITTVQGVNLGISHILTAGASFAFGRKDGRVHISRKGGLQQVLEFAEEVPVCLYDTGTKRAWLTSAVEVLLHIAWCKHKQKPFRTDDGPVSFVFAETGSWSIGACRTAMIQMASLKLYSHGKLGGDDYCFSDLVEDDWSVLDRLMAEPLSGDDTPGIPFKPYTEEKLRGWEFMDLVKPVSTSHPKETTLLPSHGGWSNLMTDINAIVLFADGFGDVIRPGGQLAGLCSCWRELPLGRDYLAANVSILNTLQQRMGARKRNEHLLSHRFKWYSPSIIFEDCGRTSSGASCKCNRLQEVVPTKTIRSIQAPYELGTKGCVAFGRQEHILLKGIGKETHGIYSQPNVTFGISY